LPPTSAGTKDKAEAQMYKKILGEEAGRVLQSVLEPLSAAMRHGCLQATEVEGLDGKLVQLCRMAVEVWCLSSVDEGPT
jgi:hypothetical protein